MKAFRTLALLVTAIVMTACASSSGAPIRALIITGQNNHNWEVSNVAIERILENSGLFEAEVAVSPSKGEDMSGFNVEFEDYDVVIVDYNGDMWNPKMCHEFEEYASNGGGIIFYHAADNSFPDWKEYNLMNALGGWEGRNEKDGPYVYWENGALVRDESEGRGGSHGFQHEYTMNCRSEDHPIVKGLPEQWMHAKDELYDRMRGPGNIGDLLYTAYSSKEKRGSGREEPLIFTVDYGKARIVHIMIGHAGETLEDNPAMQCTGFQTLLLRSAEWCAKGKVTQEIPSDFPTATSTSFRLDYR